MLYTSMTPMRVYNNMHSVPLPRGEEKTGFGSAVFVISKSQTDSLNFILSDSLALKANFFKNYYIDGIYKDKIGFKRVVKNEISTAHKEFSTLMGNSFLRQVQYSSRINFFKRKLNVVVDLGIWFNLYFKFRLNSSVKKICNDFCIFLNNKINDPLYDIYDTKVVVLDANYWFSDKTLSFNKENLNDPVTLILLTLKKYPEFLTIFGDTEFIVMDSTEGKAMKILGSSLVKKNYSLIKNKLTGFDKIKNLSIVEEPNDDLVSSMNISKQEIINHTRTNIINSVKKNFIGEIEDTTSELEDEDIDPDDDVFQMNNERNEEIENEINNYLDENPELTDSVDPTTAIKEVSDHIKKKIYISKFMPKRSEETLNRIKDLQDKQKTIIGLPSFESLESKILEEEDYTDYIDTANTNILKSSFAKFDRSYNDKKLEKDVDDAVGALQNASAKVFVTNKTVVDTSDQLNLKKTYTYDLEDETGKKMHITFDLPTIIDDKYFYLNGAKKIIQHQLILKPLVKTSPDSVWIVGQYNKLMIYRKGAMDLTASALLKFLNAGFSTYKVKSGNALIKNKDFDTTLGFDIISKSIYSFEIGSDRFVTDIPELISFLGKYNIKVDINKGIPIGYNKQTKIPIYMGKNDDYVTLITSNFTESQMNIFKTFTNVKRLMYAECTIMTEHVPLILLMLFFEGFKSVMEKANINYRFITDKKDLKNYDPIKYGTIKLQDGYILWERYPLENSIIMNGLQNLPIELYSYEELESKETYSNIFTMFHTSALQSLNLDQFKDFMIDPITKEILMDYNLPTDLVTLMCYAAKLLVDNKYLPENNFNNLRVRSNELIAYWVYNEIADAYNIYRKSWDSRKRASISIKKDAITKDLMKSKLIEDSSTLNPVLELEKNRAVTYKGERGINLEQAMTLPRRGYDESMLGVVGISTSPDSNVGVLRQLTLEPSITSTRGYIDCHNIENVNKLNSANLLTPAELLTPLGVQHDDPCRTSMAYKQSKFMLLTKDSQPTMIGNKVESVIPYHTSDEFTVVATENGTVIDKKDGIVVIKYDSGKYKSINIDPEVKKNAASGFYIQTILECNKEIGDKVKKGEVIAYNPRSYTKNKNDLSASMNLGVLAKVAVIPSWDIYEDSAPITQSLSERMSTSMVSEIAVALDKNCFVDNIKKIGDKVKTGEVLMKFNQFPDDPNTLKLLKDMREDLKEELIADNMSTIKSKYTGEIVDIKIFSTVETSELDPSVQKIIKEYHSRISKKSKLLDKYVNEGDSKYYKSGMLISESEDIVTPSLDGKIRGVKVDSGVLVIFYIKYFDNMKKGDKLAQLTALKGIVSNVIPKGLEPYSEYRPDEEISTLIAPLAITARKTPSIFLSMFGNKLLIEMKNQLKNIYEGKDPTDK